VSYDTIRDDIFTFAAKLTKSQLNLMHGTKKGEKKEKLEKKRNRVVKKKRS